MLYRILNFHHFETTVLFLKFIKRNSHHGVKLVERGIRNSNSYNTELPALKQNFWCLNSDLYQALCFGNLENQVRVLLTTGDYMMLVEAVNGIHTHTYTPATLHTPIVSELQKENWGHEFLFKLILLSWVKNTSDSLGLHWVDFFFFFKHTTCSVWSIPIPQTLEKRLQLYGAFVSTMDSCRFLVVL